MRKYSELGDQYALVGDLEQSLQLQDEQKIQRFACACCRLIWAMLPPIAQEALSLGEDYSKGLVSPKRLEEGRVKLWQFLGKDSCDFSSSKVNATRAVICCLFENIDLELAHEHVCAVMDFCNDVESRESEQFELLLKIFSDKPRTES
jgi:hypothetical protein